MEKKTALYLESTQPIWRLLPRITHLGFSWRNPSSLSQILYVEDNVKAEREMDRKVNTVF